MDIPSKAAEIIQELAAHGFEAYAVGGCVRDSILGRKPRTGILPHLPGRSRSKQFSRGLWIRGLNMAR